MQFFGGSEISPSPPAPTASGNNADTVYVFNRNGVCLLYREWNRPLHTLNVQQDHKLMFGLLFSLKSLTAKMDPTNAERGNLGVPQLPGQGCSFHSFRTNTYKLSFMESPSGIKIILVTHPRTGDLRESLKYIYNLYVDYVAKNPLYTPGTPIRCELFNTNLDQYVIKEHCIEQSPSVPYLGADGDGFSSYRCSSTSFSAYVLSLAPRILNYLSDVLCQLYI